MALIQSLENKKGEVNFRNKLVNQHKGKAIYFKRQPNKRVLLKELKKRILVTKEDFKKLLSDKTPISPFLEIGSEKCQRAVYLVNELKIQGFATDLSLDSLQSSVFFSKALGYKKLPFRICLDAYNLPFRDNSLPLVFFYETLHHFPDPKPILDEALRVLRSDGTLFINDEPIKQLINFRLWRRDYHLSPIERILKFSLILPFLSTIGKSEVDHGILEETFWLDTWEEALKLYPQAKIKIKPIFFGPINTFAKNSLNHEFKINPLVKSLIAIQGGGITINAKVQKNKQQDVYGDSLFDLLACPNCKDKPPLDIKNKKVFCKKCRSEYKFKKGVLILLSKDLERKLYG